MECLTLAFFQHTKPKRFHVVAFGRLPLFEGKKFKWRVCYACTFPDADILDRRPGEERAANRMAQKRDGVFRLAGLGRRKYIRSRNRRSTLGLF